MRLVLALVLFLSSLSPSYAQGFFGMPAIDRHARVLFNVSLPPICMSGWYGRGIGLVATCHLGWRSHVRFIDGYVLPCAVPDCRDHAMRVDHFLRYYGF